MSERYTVRVLDTPYIVVTDEREEQVEKVAKLVDHSMRALLERNPRASVTMAGIYTAFQFCDEKIKAEEVANNLRVQLQGYLEDMNKLRGELDEQRRRASSLEQELRALRSEHRD
ncbi:MAG: cell division protein ZapA [Clostridiales bacterium]|nr:cell division protein ZapA [Clostridiales bacterium]